MKNTISQQDINELLFELKLAQKVDCNEEEQKKF